MESEHYPIITPFGEAGILVEFGNTISTEIHAKVTAFADYLEKTPFDGMIEYIPAFKNVAIFYDPQKIEINDEPVSNDLPKSYRKVEKIITEVLQHLGNAHEEGTSKIVEIPVIYGGEYGPDLAYVAEYHKMKEDEIIKIHTEGEYLVYMIGFAPGFPYLGGMSEKIATPRRSSPRTAIPAGSVGIADSQTGAYPLESPGGWQIIGRTPLPLFRPKDNPPILLQSGDTVKFKAVNQKEYDHLLKEAD